MTQGIHEFKVGDIRCLAINDGENLGFDADQAAQRFPNTADDEVKAAFNSLSQQEKQFCYNPLYIEVGNQKILFDTGYGPPPGDGIGYSLGRLRESGVSPQDIDIVVITHAHGDHINGLSDADDNPIFPNARYIMSKVEWEFWMEHPEGVSADYLAGVQKTLRIMENNLHLVEPDEEIAPGVTILEAYGHTPGHIMVLIESNGERLLHIVDIAHTLVQPTHPDWNFIFDRDNEKANATRRRIMQFAVDEKLLCYSYHLFFPALGHFEANGDAFVWKPID